MSLGFGATSTRSKTKGRSSTTERGETIIELPPPTEEERKLLELTVRLARQRLQAVRQLGPLADILQEGAEFAVENILAAEAGDASLIGQRQQLARSALENALGAGEVERLLTAQEVSDIQRGGAASPRDIELIDQAADAALEAGFSDIEAGTEESLRQLRSELAPRLGLRASDSPIVDRGQLVAREAIRQKAQLARNIRGQAADLRLRFPLERGALTASRTQAQQDRAQAIRQFQQELKQRAFLNRLSLSGSAVAARTGQISGTVDPTQALAVAQQPRLAQTTTTTFGKTDSTFSQRGHTLGVGASGGVSLG